VGFSEPAGFKQATCFFNLDPQLFASVVPGGGGLRRNTTMHCQTAMGLQAPGLLK